MAAVLAAVGWYYAGVLEDEAFTVHPRTTAYHYVVLDIDDGRVTIDTARPGTDDRWSTDGTWGIEWDGGHGHLGSILAADLDAGTVTREITIGAATLEPGTRVRIENSVYMGGPADAGLIAEEVWFASPVGEFPAWVVPGDGEA